MKIKLIATLLFIASSLAACSSGADCFIADSVTKIRSFNANEVDYFIYLRISGLHEKEAFYELYTKEPAFDACGKATTLAISDVHIDSAIGIVSKLVIDNKKLIIVYKKGDTQEANYKEVQIELKR